MDLGRTHSHLPSTALKIISILSLRASWQFLFILVVIAVSPLIALGGLGYFHLQEGYAMSWKRTIRRLVILMVMVFVPWIPRLSGKISAVREASLATVCSQVDQLILKNNQARFTW